MKTAILIGNGDQFSDLSNEIKDGYIVVADGGYKYIEKYNITPDLVIGDFDSFEKEKIKCQNIITLPVHKDDTDTSYAVNYLIGKGYTEFELYGMLGGERFEHSLANIQVMANLAKLGYKAKMYSPDLSYYLQIFKGPEEIEIIREKGTKFSLFSYTEKVEELKISGAEYETEHCTLSYLNPLGISNTFQNERISISFTKGLLLAVIYKK